MSGRGLRGPRPSAGERDVHEPTGLPSQCDVHSREHELQLLLRHTPDALGEKGAVQREDLRDVGELATESLGNPELRAGKSTFPGAMAPRTWR